MSVSLAKAGLAESQRHRGDEDRAGAYDDIQAAEDEAKEKKLKLFGKEGAAPSHRFNDQSMTAQKARNFLPHLQRAGRVRGIVEYVANGGRVRLILPDLASSISFGLSGVRCPGTARGDAPSEPFADEAAFFTKLHVLQREVDIEVEASDRGGSFMGSLWVNGESLSANLLRSGYAWMSDNADRSPYYSQMEAAEKQAKASKTRVWEKYDPEAEAKAAEERATAEAKATPTTVYIRTEHVVSGNSFFCHMLGEEAKPLLEVRAKQFAQYGDFAAPSAGGRYRSGQYCSAEYTDGSMYRAKVIRHEAGSYEVSFIDYGNTHWCTADKMQPWSGDTSVPPLAYEAKLAYIKAPSVDDDFGSEAGAFLADSVLQKELRAQIVAKSGEVWHLIVFDGETCVNAESLKSGFTMLTRDAKKNTNPSKELQLLHKAVEHAKRSRINIWRHGDPESDDDEPPRRAWGR